MYKTIPELRVGSNWQLPGTCSWARNVECFESWMDLSSFEIPLWLKENSIHCFKTPLFVFSAFLFFGARICKNIHTQDFASCTSPNTFLEIWVACKTFFFMIVQNIQNKLTKSVFNASIDFCGEGAYFCHYRQRDRTKGPGVKFPRQIPIFYFTAVWPWTRYSTSLLSQ